MYICTYCHIYIYILQCSAKKIPCYFWLIQLFKWFEQLGTWLSWLRRSFGIWALEASWVLGTPGKSAKEVAGTSRTRPEISGELFWLQGGEPIWVLNLLGFHHTMEAIGNMACLFVVLSLGPKRAMTCSHHRLIEEEWKDEKQKEIKKLNES